MTKPELRKRLLADRFKLTAAEVTSKSRLITSKVIAGIDWSTIKAAHGYIGRLDANEVQTGDLHNWMRRRGVYVKIPGREVTMEELTYRFDLIIVPLVGFDRSLNRLGLGGGFYDRLLEAQPQALKIGLSYDLCLIEPAIPIEPHDQPLDRIYTESATLDRTK